MNTTTTERKTETRRPTQASTFNAVETKNFPHFTLERNVTPDVVIDEYPVGSQGSVSTIADRYYEPFDVMRPSAAKQQDFKYFTAKPTEVQPQPAPKVKKEKAAKAEPKIFEMVKKDRAAVAVYSVVLVFLVALIVATGFTVTALQKNVASLEAGIAEARNVNSQLVTQITVESNESVIKDKAEELSMVKATQVIEVSLVPASDPTEYQPNTNWFDKVCDFLSGIFG